MFVDFGDNDLTWAIYLSGMSYIPPADSDQIRLGRGYVLREHVKNYPINFPCNFKKKQLTF